MSALVLLAASTQLHASQITWSFADGLAAPSSELPAGLTAGAVTTAQAGGTSTLGTTSASSGYDGASGSYNFSIGSAPGGTLSTATSAYFTFTLDPIAGHGVHVTSLTLGSRSTGTGPTTLALYSSFDGFGSAIGSVSTDANSTWALIDFGSFSLTTAADESLTFRIYGGDGSGTGSGNWRIDDITVQASAVPEPATYALFAGVGMLGLVGYTRLRNRRKAVSENTATLG